MLLIWPAGVAEMAARVQLLRFTDAEAAEVAEEEEPARQAAHPAPLRRHPALSCQHQETL